MVSVSEVNDAVSSLKAAMMDGTADRSQVIDMLTVLLRGGDTTPPPEVSQAPSFIHVCLGRVPPPDFGFLLVPCLNLGMLFC